MTTFPLSGWFAQSWLPINPSAKLLLLAFAIVVLLLLARWLSGGGEPGSMQSPGELDESPVAASASLRSPFEVPRALAPPRDQFRTFLPEPNLGTVRVLNLYFAGFDLESGPPNPDEFCDELFIELHDPDTAHRWTQSYLVASPRGLARTLEERGWDCLFADSIVVFRRYDAQEIRRTLLEHIAEEQKLARSSGRL